MGARQSQPTLGATGRKVLVPLSADAKFLKFIELPAELVILIAEFITSPVDKLCLCLTCKPLLELLDGPKALRQQFRRPAPFWLDYKEEERKLRDGSFWNQKEFGFRKDLQGIQWQLLRRIETKYWRCCSPCLMLHPHYEFNFWERGKSANTRACAYNDHLYASLGTVSICQCITLTIRDRARLSESIRKGISLPGIPSAPQKPLPWKHKCSATYPAGGGTIVIDFTADSVLGRRGAMSIVSSYHITGEGTLPRASEVPRLFCPHRSVGAHLQDICMVQLLQYKWHHTISIPDPRKPRTNRCFFCDTLITYVEGNVLQTVPPFGGQYEFRFLTERPLGEFREGGVVSGVDLIWYWQTDVCYETQGWWRRRGSRHYQYRTSPP